MHTLTTQFEAELEDAIRLFGTSFHEELDIWEMVAKLRELSADESAEVLHEMYMSDAHDGLLALLAVDLIHEMEDWDDIWQHPLLEDLID